MVGRSGRDHQDSQFTVREKYVVPAGKHKLCQNPPLKVGAVVQGKPPEPNCCGLHMGLVSLDAAAQIIFTFPACGLCPCPEVLHCTLRSPYKSAWFWHCWRQPHLKLLHAILDVLLNTHSHAKFRIPTPRTLHIRRRA